MVHKRFTVYYHSREKTIPDKSQVHGHMTYRYLGTQRQSHDIQSRNVEVSTQRRQRD